MSPINPYIAGDPVGNSHAFVGREDILRDVLKVLRNPHQNAITLFGQRRIGKTSMLQYLQAHLPDEGDFRAVYFDLQYKASWTLPRILVDLAQTIAEQLNLPTPEIPIPLNDTGVFRNWLEDILAHLPSKTCIILLLDEFDVLTDPPAISAIEFFPYLRKLDLVQLKFVFVLGRNINDLNSIALPVFKGVISKRVSLISQADTFKLLRISEANQTLHWTDESAEAVWNLTHGHPFLTQALCQQIWDNVYDTPPQEIPTITPEIVEEAVNDALEASSQALKWLWDGLGPAEKVVSAALAEAGNVVVDETHLEHILRDSGVKILIRELQDVPELLNEWDVLEPVDGGYMFRVEILRRWITRSHPLRRTLDELDRIVPTADGLFQAARGYYEQGKLEEAEPLLRQALGLNPSHLRANELFAEILIALSRLDEARDHLERLIELTPNIARPRLLQVYLAQARAAEDNSTRLMLYKKVLILDLAHREAQVEIERIEEFEREAAEMRTGFSEGRKALVNAEWNQAIERFKIVITKEPRYASDGETAAELLAQAVRKDIKLIPTWKTRLRQPQTWFRFGAFAAIAFVVFFAFGAGLQTNLITAQVQGTPSPIIMVVTQLVSVIVTPTHQPSTPESTQIPTDIPISSPIAPTFNYRNMDGMTEVYIKGGTFQMGSDDDYFEKPVHQVTLDAFWIDKTEVTNEMFARFLNFITENNSFDVHNGDVYIQNVNIFHILSDENIWNRIAWNGQKFSITNDTFGVHPVANVTWFGAHAYCTWVGARLPTEAEWEYAARGTDGRRFPWGTQGDCQKVNIYQGCDGYSSTAPVGSFVDNKHNGKSYFDLYDMGGNVSEWVNDWYDKVYYERPSFVNPLGAEYGTEKVMRGGSWQSKIYDVRTSSRSAVKPVEFSTAFGFRCARSQQP